MIRVKPYHWEYEDKATDNDGIQIRAWALDCESQPYLLRIEGFPASCFIEFPMFIGYSMFRWDVGPAALFVESLRRRMGAEYGPLPFKPNHFGWYKKLYYYRGEHRYPMVMLMFRSVEAMHKTENVLAKPFEVENIGTIMVNVWESDIDPIRKLLTKCSISHTCWIDCKAVQVPDGERISTLPREYMVDWTSVTRLSNDIADGLRCSPGVMAFDIEVYSNRHKMFPDMWNDSHVAYMISCTYQRIGSKDRIRYGIIMGDCNDIPEDQFSNTMVLTVNTEEELVRMMAAVVMYHDPEIITGYNIFGFDYPYLDARLQRAFSTWGFFSRLKGRICTFYANKWSSGGFGHKSINYPICPGRISIDMLIVVRDGFKLSTYSLNAVAGHFLGKSKHDISAKEMFVIYEEMVAGIRAGKDTQQYTDAIANMTRVMLYCIQDSELVLDLIDKLYFWVGANEMSDIVGVNISELSTVGMQKRVVAQLYNLAANSGFILTTRASPDIPYQGGAVQPPTPGLHEQVLCVDFTSLYPSIMIDRNICLTTFVPADYYGQISDDQCNIGTIECNAEHDPEGSDDDDSEEEGGSRHASKGQKGSYTFKFVKSEVQKGLIPTMLSNLLSQRGRVKKQLGEAVKEGKDPDLIVILDKRQLALKVAANSTYGVLGMREGGRISLLEGAIMVTWYGRYLIGVVNKWLQETYNAVVIYGDTDSSMIRMPDQIKCNKDCWVWGPRLAKEISALFPADINIEFEKAMKMLSIMKKNYAGLLIGKDGEFYKDKKGNLEIFKRGIHSTRRDNCKWSREAYDDILIMVLTGESLATSSGYLISQVNRLIKGEVEFEDLIIVRTLNSHYKSATYFMKLFSDELRRAGKPAQAGDRLEYLVMEKPGVEHLGKRMMLKETYVELLEAGTPSKIDYLYYLEKVIGNAAGKLIGVGYNTLIAKLDNISYRPNNRCKLTYLNDIVKMIIRMLSMNVPLDSLHTAIKESLVYLENMPPVPDPIPTIVLEDDTPVWNGVSYGLTLDDGPAPPQSPLRSTGTSRQPRVPQLSLDD